MLKERITEQVGGSLLQKKIELKYHLSSFEFRRAGRNLKTAGSYTTVHRK